MTNAPVETIPENLLEQVQAEYTYARNRWGLDFDENVNTPIDWTNYICQYSTRWVPEGPDPMNHETLALFKVHMIKVANLALTAAEEAQKILDGTNERPDILPTTKGNDL